MNSKILLPQNTLQSAFSGFPDIKKILKSLTTNVLYLSIICFNPGIQKISLEGLKKNINEIYNIEKKYVSMAKFK